MFIDFFLIFIVKSFQQILRILPEHIQQATGVFFGRTAFLLIKKRRKVAISNIKRVFPSMDKDEIVAIAKRCFEKLGINFIESIVMPYLPKEEYKERFTLEGRTYADDALKMNKGIMALLFHYGNWEIMGVASFVLQREIIALARPLKRHKYINDFLNKLRHSTGLTIIANENTGRDVIRYLKENRIVAVLGDQREKRSRGVYVEFFGEKVPTSKGIATICMKTGTPIIPVYPVREGFLRYRIVCSEPLEMERKGNIDELIHKNTRKINAFLESIIVKNPDEWFWVHRRWGRM
ncbi:MAG: lysophospholipid acyltransferase family protein [Proteobacteria bacterium]|nr:lysophospholipid acyltransferase family protein [Pseudomonadota bacterium]